MVDVILISLLALGLAAALLWLARTIRRELAALRGDSAAQLTERNSQVDRRLGSVIETMDRRLAELDTKVDRRLENASRQTNEIHKQLGEVGRATEQLAEQAKGLGQLQQILRPPKARGGFGELLLENLLRDRLPATAYALQHGFSGGERVDAVIRVDRLVPIDAKFPLDNFERMLDAQEDGERQLYEKAFGRDVKGHVDAIASKYIRPEENTYDFAFMYLPSEAIYYELACGRTGQLLAYAHDKRVFPVSPTTLTAYLQVVALGLKGLQIEQHAQEVMAYCARLGMDFAKFKVDFDLVGTHLGRAHGKFADAEKRLDRFEAKLDQASDHETAEVVAATEFGRQLDAVPPVRESDAA
jgi:DNA recombination protein RmuC